MNLPKLYSSASFLIFSLFISACGSGLCPLRNSSGVCATSGSSYWALDNSFGSDGMAAVSFGSIAEIGYALALQPDEKVIIGGMVRPVVLGYYGAARFNTDGSLDTNFNGTGKTWTNLGGAADEPHAVAIQTDGKIVLAGYAINGTYDVGVARYHSNGSIDTTFNTTGFVETTVGAATDQADGVVIQPDGKIVTAGACNMPATSICLVRYHSNGSLDTTFNSTGRVTTLTGTSAGARSILLQADGKLVVGGYSNNGTDNDFALARYHSNGSLDTNFNGSGTVTTPISSGHEIITAMVFRPDGKIVVAGHTNGVPPNDVFIVAQYNTDGSLDSTFGTAGKTSTEVRTFGDYAFAIALQPDGKIIVGGQSSNGADTDFAIVRYTSSGALDLTFNNTGKIIKDHSTFDTVKGIAIQSDGKIIVGGTTFISGQTYLAILRFRSY